MDLPQLQATLPWLPEKALKVRLLTTLEVTVRLLHLLC